MRERAEEIPWTLQRDFEKKNVGEDREARSRGVNDGLEYCWGSEEYSCGFGWRSGCKGD